MGHDLSDAFSLWHDFRVPFLISVVIILLILRYVAINHTKWSAPIPSIPSNADSPVGSIPSDRSSKKLHYPQRPPRGNTKLDPRRVLGTKIVQARDPQPQNHGPTGTYAIQPLIFYATIGGATKVYASRLADAFRGCMDSAHRILEPQTHDLAYVDLDEFFINTPTSPGTGPNPKYFYMILLPTYDIDTIIDNFVEHLKETHNDFRIDTAPLSAVLGYSVFGFGDKDNWPSEDDGYCSQAKVVDRWMAKLTNRKRAFPLGMGDTKSDADARLEEWRVGIEDVLLEFARTGSLGAGIVGSGAAIESDEEDETAITETVALNSRAKRRARSRMHQNVEDVEDIGRSLSSTKANAKLTGAAPVDFTTYRGDRSARGSDVKEMVPKSSPTYTALTKQGYSIVGSHSGVKICRWTKSALRGRGSCYKYSFYGIKSHLCMETTPSLSCSNKCVFCWRHGTNPVGTTWRWKIDPPEMIFAGVTEGHYKKIKMMKGVPGVRAERFAEAMKIRHCALSLVGEPIFYPYINEFTGLLHKNHISSFLVCNAQHPDQLSSLKPVTQLYVSIDASNKDSLRKIDRPLHRDFWERFLRCLDILREKRYQQRTVFRLTLVKGFNIEDEAEGYADLVARGLPCFIEIKGVTYCGTSTAAGAGLTMHNVPFYEEVCTFVRALDAALARRGLAYGIAAEHAHSCCVLLASKRFLIRGKWHTLIDYDKFFECLESGKPFGPEDYVGAYTPEWALWGNGGFDPADVRVDRKGKLKELRMLS